MHPHTAMKFLLILLPVLAFIISRPLVTLDPSFLLLDRNQEIIQVLPNKNDKYRLSVKLEDVPKDFVDMLISIEDKHFFHHPGVNPFSLTRAFYQMVKANKVVSGGSTLTMQVARLLEPRPRTIWSKVIECIRALQLEAFYSKKEILELYLMLAPYGGNLEGIRAASLSYFQKESRHLTLCEIALLIAIPQSPTGLRPYKYPKRAKLARDKILTQLQKNFPNLARDLEASKTDPMSETRYPFKTLALHITPRQKIHETTLDMHLQERLEKFLKDQKFPPHQTAVLMVVDNKTRQILAYIGSANYFDESRLGFVDVLRSTRSPGSTLKPFIYALAFDEGIADPNSLIDDNQTDFAGYKPKNFKDVFHGEVSVSEALQHSFNIPAVILLEKLGCQNFSDRLKSLPVTLKSPRPVPESLPIALGGVGISLWDLTSLYVGLANKGEFSPISYTHQNNPKTSRLCSEKSADQISEILENAPLPNHFVGNGVPIAFKTGTSYGYRDALCVGYTKAHTVLVWLGRADGSPMANVIGRNDAAPLVLSIFYDFLPKGASENRSSSSFTYLPKALKKIALKPTKNIEITYPKDKSEYLLSDHKIVFKTKEKNLFWYVNDQLQSTNEWLPTKLGFYTIRAVDSLGNSDEVTIRIVE